MFATDPRSSRSKIPLAKREQSIEVVKVRDDAFAAAQRGRLTGHTLEPRINGAEVELPDIPILTEQLLTLVHRGAKIDHQVGDHDDFANSLAGVVNCVLGRPRGLSPSDLYGPDGLYANAVGGA